MMNFKYQMVLILHQIIQDYMEYIIKKHEALKKNEKQKTEEKYQVLR